MGTSKVVSDMKASDALDGKSDPRDQEKRSNEELPQAVSSGSAITDAVNSEGLEQSQTPQNPVHELQANQEKNNSMDSSRNCSSDGLASEALQKSCSTGASALVNSSQGAPTNVVTAGDGVSVSNEDASVKVHHIQSPDSKIREVQVTQETTTLATMPEKAVEDGYNWRKYGQKHVKGNEFIRSYYKCTHPGCQVKKQVERSHDGQITDTLYFGSHDHPTVQPVLAVAGYVLSARECKKDEPSAAPTEEKSSNAHVGPSHQMRSSDNHKVSTVTGCETDAVTTAVLGPNKTREEVFKDEKPESKRRKQDCCNVDAIQADKRTGESRIVVQTTSEVDIVNDGYRWRKYGQKLVKGNPNPRSYYRCSNPGCPVKKHVERASHDPKVVVTTYEGQHDHDLPPVRTVTHNTPGSNANGDSRAESEESDMAGHEVIVQYSLHSESRPHEHRQPDAAPVHS